LAAKLSEEDKKTLMDKCEQTLKWLESNQLAEKDEFQHKQKELERTCQPIISKLYQGAGPAGGCGGQTQAGAQGPTIEEVD
ncbi:heat shock 70 kDa protein 1-like, partial [Hippocampus comes]|uniref:heat shock 70 kDa protein 1-like n=1 Tax=Hippocampus comes TaxID=109280 RepID=UPI00094E38D1